MDTVEKVQRKINKVRFYFRAKERIYILNLDEKRAKPWEFSKSSRLGGCCRCAAFGLR